MISLIIVRRVMDRPGLSFLEESRVVLDNEEESEQSLCDEEGDSIRNSYLKQQQWLELTTVLLAIVVEMVNWGKWGMHHHHPHP